MEIIYKTPKDVEDEYLCVVCQTNKRDSVFMNCRHMLCCHDCAITALKTNNICFVCREIIDNIMKIYW